MKILSKGLHFEMPKGVIIYLTDENEQVTKLFLTEQYNSETDVYIYETDEVIKLKDIFET